MRKRTAIVTFIVLAVVCLFVFCASDAKSEVKLDGFAQGIWTESVHATSNQFGFQTAYLHASNKDISIWLNLGGGEKKILSQFVWTFKVPAFNLWKLHVPESKACAGKIKPPASRAFCLAPWDVVTIYSPKQNDYFDSRDFGVMWTVQSKDTAFTVKTALVNGQEAVSSYSGVDSNSWKDTYIRTTVRPFRHFEVGMSARYGKAVEYDNRIIGGDIFLVYPKWTFTVESFWCEREHHTVMGYGLLTVTPAKNVVLIVSGEEISDRTTGMNVWYTTIGASYAWSDKHMRLALNFIDPSGDTQESAKLALQLQHVF